MRLESAQITEEAVRLQRINANALHRVNRAVGSDRMRMPSERLTSEVRQFDDLDAEIKSVSDALLDTLGSAVEDDEVTDAKWDEWIAMDAQEADMDLPPDAQPDPLEDAINEIMQKHPARRAAVPE